MIKTRILGAVSKSHGFNAAKMAGLPDAIIENGISTAKDLEITIIKIEQKGGIYENSLDKRYNLVYCIYSYTYWQS